MAKTKEQKQKEAAERQAIYDAIPLEQKLSSAGKKERPKIERKIEKSREASS